MVAIDDFADYSIASTVLTAPWTHQFAITPHDTNELSHVTRAFQVAESGYVCGIARDDGAAVSLYCAAGVPQPGRLKLVTTDSTATGIVGLY